MSLSQRHSAVEKDVPCKSHKESRPPGPYVAPFPRFVSTLGRNTDILVGPLHSLMHSACNVKLGKQEQRQLLTGVHTVADIFCVGCSSRLGWTYLRAYDSSQKYKEGKYLFESERIFKDNAWELDDD